MSRQLENEHYRRIAGYELAIKRLYDRAIKQAAGLSVGVKVSDKMFRFSDYSALKGRANKIISELAKDMIGTIQTGINEEWEYANLKNDALVDEFVKGTSLSKSAARSFTLRNVSAQKAFRERVVNGMNLSDRVWKLSGQFRQELEMSLDVGIREGKSAARISQDIRPQLNEPDKLFRRVRNQHGQLALSKNAAAYHPGQGVYRSSYKNALRLTRTETNMAYRTADHERWKQMDFIVGIEVIRSNNPYGCDICGSMAGKYPKDFKFVSWHPQCRCYATPIMITRAEMEARWEGKTIKSRQEVTQPPAGFKKWILENNDTIQNSKSKPYFITDNQKFVDEITKGG